MEKEEFSALYRLLCSAYSRSFDSNEASVYYEFLKNYEYDNVKRIISEAINYNKYFPTISELKEIIEPSDLSTAWYKVLEVARNGGWGWENLTDLEIVTVAEIGGMASIQNSSDDGLPFLFNKFEKVFPIMKKRDVNLRLNNIRLKTLNLHHENLRFIEKSETYKKLLGEKR